MPNFSSIAGLEEPEKFGGGVMWVPNDYYVLLQPELHLSWNLG